MNNDTRQASGGGSKSKRRLTEADEEAKQTPAADDLASNPKRQRVSRACDSCRSKKDKCDGVQPVCSTCASLSRPCTYKANPKKRGLPTGYIRTLELLWGLVFSKIQGSEEVVRALLRAANIPSHLATMGKEAEGSDTLLSSWKNSIVLKEIERLLTYLEQPEDDPGGVRLPGETYSPQDAEGSSVISTDALEWNLSEVLGEAREGSLSMVSPIKTPTAASTMTRTAAIRVTRDTSTQTIAPLDTLDELSNPSLARLPSHLTSNSDPIMQKPPQLPSNAWALFDIYFTYTHCWFPILEKHDILRTAFRHNDGDDEFHISLTNPGSGDHAALWAVLTLASIQEASISATRQLAELSAERPDPSQLYATAKSLIPGADGVHELGHVQALLILSLVKVGQQDWTAAWLLVGQAVRVSQALGLNQPPTGQSQAPEDGKSTGRSKHVFLGCFILETLVAMQTGQVPSLRKDELLKIGPVNEDGLEEWHPWEDQTGLRPIESSRASFHRGPLHALSAFNRLTSLLCILNDLCCLKQTSAGPISQLEALERQLQLWVSALPKTYRVGIQLNQTKVASPHIFNLEMVYEGVATNLSLLIASHRDDRMVPDIPRKKRALESSKRLLSLLQTYMETYSLSATCPIFGMVLTFATFSGSESANAALPFELDPGLKHKLQSFSAHLATVWNVKGRESGGLIPPDRMPGVPTPVAPAANRQRSLSNRESISQNAFPQSNLQTPTEAARRKSPMDEPRSNFATPDAFFSHSWMRTSNLEENVALSIPTPAPSLNITTTHGNEPPLPPSQLKESITHHPRTSISSSKPMNGTPMIPDLTSPFHPVGPQYQQAYSDPNLAFGSFVDIDGYGTRRPKIAPDLDALFDELASLDGTEKTDNQPEFMQNLGFVPDAGVPEIYSYSTQVEPFLLAQTQQQVPCPEPGMVRRESQAVESGKRA
ncbi:putative C6 transcription factor QutA [Aspergillus saccharolyticus JOP 1030-1]|uniref:Quinic acid utilization activator n=1 Tax=Aspergillus saccharolyticus JOP 1030-1 TaxID=1450539 RepID=A0A318ZIF0_9EURO|nr:quinic acid utilization activator [Aspergillus saccharolyticus JOP 1030-1]PYH44353.1 quinic acid utilization activator [Aspergillus saccharolyticus JOP 1030-1]